MNDKSTNKPASEHATFLEIRAFACKFLTLLFTKVLDSVETSFRNIIEDLNDPKEKYKLTDKLSGLQTARQSILEDISTEFGHMLNGEKEPQTQNAEQGLSLSLVEEEDLDESILISDVSGKIAEKFDLPIRAIRRGIVRLSRKLDFEPDPDALTPKHLAKTLQSSISQLGFGLSDKSIIYSCFRDISNTKLKTLYTGTLTLLQECGVIDETENPISPNFELVYAFRDSGNIANVSLATTATITTETEESEIGEETLHELLNRRSSQQLAPHLPPPIAASTLTGAIFQDGALTRLLYDYLSTPHNTPTISASGKQLTPIESEKLISMLSNLQTESGSEHTDTSINSDNIKQLITSRFDTGDDSTEGHIPHIESNVIDLINKLFVAILEDPDIPDPVKVQFGRLQIPYIKVALLDLNFLKDESHPARLLLNEISIVGMGVNDASNPALIKIREAAQHIIDQFETDLNVFAQLLEDMRAFHDEHQEKASKAEKKTRGKAEQQAKLLFLKKNVIQQVRKFLKGKELPKALYAIVLKGFAPLFLKIHHAKGDDNDEWREAVNLFRLIVESAQVKDSVYQLGVIAERAPEILQRVSNILKNAARPEITSTLLADLQSYYQEKTSEYEALKHERDNEKAPAVEDTSDPFDYGADNEDLTLDQETQNQIPVEEIIARLPENVKPDSLCEVYMGRNIPTQRLKIASILKDTAQIVFIDSTGHEAQIKDVLEFIDELDCERSKVIKDNNLFDKALASVITNLQFSKSAA